MLTARWTMAGLLAIIITMAATVCAWSMSLTVVSAAAEADCPNEALRSENLSLPLPDCRAYEVASPTNAPDEVYIPNTQANEQQGDFFSNEPFLASSLGDTATYGGDPLALGGTGARGNRRGNEFLTARGPEGWHAADIQPSSNGETASEAQQSIYQAISFDPAYGIFGATSQAIATAAGGPPCTEGTGALYKRDANGVLASLLVSTNVPGQCGHPLFVGASADQSQLFFQTEAALTPGAVESGLGSSEVNCPASCNLYDSHGGRVSSINVLPNGSMASHATFGAPSLPENNQEEPDLSHAVSATGARAYWTDEETGVVYLRRHPDQPENCLVSADACTAQVSAGPARYWSASNDGRYAYYTEAGGLWRFDAEAGLGAERVALTGAAAEVQGVLGVNEEGTDGAYVYLVAGGALAGTGASTRTCAPIGSATPEEIIEREEENKENKLPAHHGCNLYLIHGNEVTLIATLAPGDNSHPVAPSVAGQLTGGDWRPSLGRRTAQPTPDGHAIVFQSAQPLTGYDTSSLKNDGALGTQQFTEVFIYNADTRSLSCASCNPTGESPVEVKNPNTSVAPSLAATYMHRWVSSDASRVFFNTAQPLSSADANSAQDVYEWERQGAGSCSAGSAVNGGGCVFLISGGRGVRESPASNNKASETAFDALFTDASASGNDVFFVTRPSLLPIVNYETKKLYDARVGGGFPVSARAGTCLGEGCRQPGAMAPSGQALATSIASGLGNVAPLAATPAVKVKSKAASPTKAQMLTKALRACRKMAAKRKRRACEARARRRYGHVARNAHPGKTVGKGKR